MKLTSEQLDEIKGYIKDMGIKYFDVQMEILDHTACKIEEKLTKNPKISFDDAFYETRLDFGFTEYKDFEKSFKKTVIKQSVKIRNQTIKNCLLLKNIPVIILSMTALFFSSSILGVSKATVLFSLVILGLSIIVISIQYYRLFLMRKMFTMQVMDGVLAILGAYFWLKLIPNMSNDWYWSFGFTLVSITALLYLYGVYVSSTYGFKRSKEILETYKTTTTI